MERFLKHFSKRGDPDLEDLVGFDSDCNSCPSLESENGGFDEAQLVHVDSDVSGQYRADGRDHNVARLGHFGARQVAEIRLGFDGVQVSDHRDFE